ncbi:unnamed protein product [Mytilus coruscus]|uniref:Uncharacterized protein n=1 Tax=Mytilus coruscus TaxID=42192 RepID=A0A6J8DI51_MYTCO|nr:unnamed protein product [Mytilus coruscus]
MFRRSTRKRAAPPQRYNKAASAAKKVTAPRSSVGSLQHLSESIVNGDDRNSSCLINMPFSGFSMPGVDTTHMPGTHTAVSVPTTTAPPVFSTPTPDTTGNTQLTTHQNFILQSTKASDELGMYISIANKEKIANGEFIDLACLLQNTNIQNNSIKQTICFVPGELVLQQKQQQQKITNIDQWTELFLVFISVYCLACPEKFQELLKYTNNIRIAA